MLFSSFKRLTSYSTQIIIKKILIIINSSQHARDFKANRTHLSLLILQMSKSKTKDLSKLAVDGRCFLFAEVEFIRKQTTIEAICDYNLVIITKQTFKKSMPMSTELFVFPVLRM